VTHNVAIKVNLKDLDQLLMMKNWIPALAYKGGSIFKT
jgi:hypothetical protein